MHPTLLCEFIERLDYLNCQTNGFSIQDANAKEGFKKEGFQKQD
jgi:hypothetical protein